MASVSVPQRQAMIPVPPDLDRMQSQRDKFMQKVDATGQ